MTTKARCAVHEMAAHRLYNITSDALARGVFVDYWTRGRTIIVTLTHPSLGGARHSVGRTLEQACDRAAERLRKVPAPVPGGAR